MALNKLEDGMLVLCTVKKIIGTTVFVNIEEYEKEGTIVTSEIAPGRIRNLRDYVVPGKKIVCKVLRVVDNAIDLSLRRVTSKEKKEVLEDFERERKAIIILKMIFGENYEEILKDTLIEITEKYGRLYLFFQERDDKEIIKFFGNEKGGKIISILSKIKEKKIEVVRKIKIFLGNGSIEMLNNLFSELPKGFEIKYISAPNYQIIFSSKDYKEANKEMDNFISKIKENAKKLNVHIEEGLK